MKKITHLVFILIWVFMAFSFLYLTLDAKELKKTKLAIYAQNIPKGYNIQFAAKPKPISITEIINGIANSHNQNVKLLEKSIHQSAKTSIKINLLSFILCCFGLVAQTMNYMHDKKKE